MQMNRNALGARFRRERQPDEKPSHEEHDSEKLWERGRNVNQRAAEHAAERRADKAKKIINTARRSSARCRHVLAKKRGKYRLIDRVTEEKRRAAEIE